MKLYKDYKADEERIKQEESDRKEAGLAEETVIIYEQDTVTSILLRGVKTVAAILLFIAILIAIGGGIMILAGKLEGMF